MGSAHITAIFCNSTSLPTPLRASAISARNSSSRERRLLGRALDFDDAAGTGHDEIGIGLGLGILGVIEIEHRRALIDAAGHRGDVVAQRLAASISRVFIQAMQSCSATQAPVIDAVRVPPSAWMTSQSTVSVARRALRDRQWRAGPPDQPLDLDRAAALLAGGGLAVTAERPASEPQPSGGSAVSASSISSRLTPSRKSTVSR